MSREEDDDFYDPLSPVEEAYAEALGLACRSAPDRRQSEGLWGAIPELAELLDLLPSHLHDDALTRIVRLSTLLPELRPLATARQLVQQTAARYPERAHLRGATFDLRWRCGSWKSKGRIILGKAGPVPRAERECWQGGTAPDFRITLNLLYWILAGEREQARLIHHEMGHCAWKEDSNDPTGAPHHMEEFSDTIARFGLLEDSEGDALVALAILDHPETEIHVRAVRGKQQEMFAPTWQGKATGPARDVDLDQARHEALARDPEFARAVADLVRPDENTHVTMTFTDGQRSVTVTSDDVPRLEAKAKKASRKKEPAPAAKADAASNAASTPSADQTLELSAHLLGTMPDEDLAKHLGLTTSLVAYTRRQKKIPAYTQPEGARP